MKLLKILLVSMFLMSAAACGDDDTPNPPDSAPAADSGAADAGFDAMP